MITAIAARKSLSFRSGSKYTLKNSSLTAKGSPFLSKISPLAGTSTSCLEILRLAILS